MRKEITKTDAQEILKKYDLGLIQKLTPLRAGYVNYSYLAETDKGKFVIQEIGDKMDKWKKGRLKKQFYALEVFHKDKFKYKTPRPLKNKNGIVLSKYKGKNIWVYEYIDGKVKNNITLKEFKKIAKATAELHKFSEGKIKFKDKYFSDFDWVEKEYKKRQKIKVKNKTDSLMKENAEFILKIIKELKKLKYGKNIFNHSDLDESNVVFEGNNLKGIFDFDDCKMAPAANDIGIAVIRMNEFVKKPINYTIKEFLIEYEKINPLTKQEKDLIIPCILKDCCSCFLWFHKGMKKNDNKRYELMKQKLDETKIVYNEWKKSKKD